MNNQPIKPNSFKTKRVMQVFALLAVATFLNTGVAVAAPETAKSALNKSDQGPIAAVLTLKKVVVDAQGKETLIDAPKIEPGDVLEYRTVYRNRSKQAISGLNASLPVPFGLAYLDHSAKPSNALASVDNTNYEPIPLKRVVKDKDGKSQQIDVPLAEYRGLRWTVDTLDAGKKTEVSARMRVIELPKSPEELVKKPASAAGIIVQPSANPVK